MRLAIDERRRRRRWGFLPIRKTDQSWALATDPDLWRALDDLDRRTRAALVMTVLDGYTQEEVAEILGVPRGTVASWLARQGADPRRTGGRTMTDDLDRRLRVRLERLADAVPMSPGQAEHPGAVVRPRLAARPSLGALTMGVGALLVVVAVIVVGGSDRTPTTGAESPPAVVATGAPPSPSPSSSASPTSQTGPSAEQMAASVQFRTFYDLRADEEWIRSVYADPTANYYNFGVPLLPAEADQVFAKSGMTIGTPDIVAGYGQTVPEDWAGLYIDQAAGARVVALFKAHLAEHEAALRALLPPDANFEVHPATWSNEELRGFMAQIEQERDWFPTIGTSFYAVESGALDDFNRIRLRFKGPDPDAAASIEAHFGNPPWLYVIWYGPEDWTGARGNLEIYVRDTAGRPVAGLTVGVRSLDERVRGGEDAWITNKDGRRIFIKNLPAVAWQVFARDHVRGELVVLGKARVEIRPDDLTTVTVIIK